MAEVAEKTLIVIAGPTASGKTALAIEAAQHFHTEILSFDSRQCYRELSIGVAKPSDAELAAVKHHFINSHSIHQPVDAAMFEQFALQTLDRLFSLHNVVVAVGGTGLYLKALCEGLDDMPSIDPLVRQQVRIEYEEKGLQWLQQAVAQEDPAWFAAGEIYNPHRLLRVLEVKRQTGHSILSFRSGRQKDRPFHIRKFAIDIERLALYERINKRVDIMMQSGLLDEAKGLLPFAHLQALQTVGYAELFEYLRGESDLETAVDNIKTNTRHYAKRQLTWFKKDTTIKWLPYPEVEAIVQAL